MAMRSSGSSSYRSSVSHRATSTADVVTPYAGTRPLKTATDPTSAASTVAVIRRTPSANRRSTTGRRLGGIALSLLFGAQGVADLGFGAVVVPPDP